MVVRRPEINLAIQALTLQRLVPGSTAQIHRGRLNWFGDVQPTPDTRSYSLRLKAAVGQTPSVRVLRPALQPNEDGWLPHVYDTGDLCLSEYGDWHPRMLFADTYVPWAMEWLMYYELWLATGLWYGDGPDNLDDVSQSSILHRVR
ncbi:hypothetical protein [Kribbella sp. NPDC051770]|uniref:hypothetical protein n=1 Tax=Kribbella sp. NPDC051770 TaxID=3155413 RepID=UPI0034461D80